jgi:serine/threonine-protein kinase
MDNNMDKYIGKLFDGRYEILERIGVGGMAVVYKALDHRLNRYVAVKILKDELAVDEDFRHRFHTESQAVAMLSHSNIVAVYDVSRTSDVEYIVMELIEGITLKQYMQKRGVLTWKEALHFSSQITKALSHAHSRGIVHRDIKPHNIMILMDSSVKVADFGIARLQSTQNTLTQETLGSVHYISPEQAKGSHVDARTDIYSLGVVMYEMLTGRLPFEGDSAVSVAIQHISSIPLMPREINPDIPPGLEAIIMKAMNPDLKQRYQSADELFEDLENFRKNPEMDFEYNELAFIAPGIAEEKKREEVQEQELMTGRKARWDSVKPVSRKGDMDKEEYIRKNRGSRRVSTLTGVLLVILFFIGIFIFLWNYIISEMFDKPDTLDVPNWVGSSYEEVSTNTAYTSIYNFIPTWKLNDEYEFGYIISQSPTEGRKVVKKEGKINVYLDVSSGSEIIIMPNVVNKEYRQAELELNRMDIYPVVTFVPSESVTNGYVISTVPEAGDSLKPGDSVLFTVSAGPEILYVSVPELNGRTEANARTLLESMNLTPGDVEAVESEKPKGTVVWQSISAGTEVAEHTKINFHISLGPAETPSPSPSPSPTPTEEITPEPTPSDDPGMQTEQPSATIPADEVTIAPPPVEG